MSDWVCGGGMRDEAVLLQQAAGWAGLGWAGQQRRSGAERSPAEKEPSDEGTQSATHGGGTAERTHAAGTRPSGSVGEDRDSVCVFFRPG